MPAYGTVSRERLDTCHPDLQMIMEEVIVGIDIAIICGHRNESAQRTAYEQNKSQVTWPDSKHNSYPSRAVDIALYPIDWDDIGAFHIMVGWVLCVAEKLYREGTITHRIRSGADWNGNLRTNDNSFDDLGHFELIES